jgi:L-cystine transport system ATP-binding protein
MISLSGIVKTYAAQPVLHGVDLALEAGSVTTLIGPSGSGKSTLLRCVNLLEVPQAGALSVAGQTLSFTPQSRPARDAILAVRRATGMIFQDFQLFAHRTVLQNVMESLLTVHRWAPPKARARALELLEKVGMQHKADAWPGELSGGQQQRVAIARAMAPSPQILLCDEPTSALDPELAGDVINVLAQLAAEGTTMLIATHDLRLAAHIAHQVVFLDAGRIVERGSPQEIFAHPSQQRTETFVATLNSPLPDWVI